MNLYDLIAQHLVDEQDQKAKRRPASVDTRRMAETGTGSGRSPSGAVAEGETPND